MSTQTNSEIVRRFFDERWNKGNLDVYDELRADTPNVENERAWVQRCLAAFQDYELTLPHLVAEDDRVAVHFRSSATFANDFSDLFKAGESVTFEGMALLRLEDGKIVEDIAFFNDPKIIQFLRQV